MSDEIVVSILLVCYNAKRYLEGCLNSVREKVTVPYEVILLDNASVDGTADFVQDQFSWVRLLRSDENLGFTKGNNFVERHARGKYYLLLNPDTVLLSDITPALQLLEQDRTIGIVGGQALRGTGETGISTGWFPTALRLWRVKNLWMQPTVPYGSPESAAYKVEWLEGAFLMTRAENWRALGGLDEYYFLGIDDIDFCRATSDRGLAVVQCAKVRYTHFGGYTPSRAKFVYAGFRHYHKKFSSPAHRLLAELVLRVGLWLRIAIFGVWYGLTRNQTIGERWRSCVETNKVWPQMAP